MKILSFGAGVQSSVMLMMAIRHELPKPDHVIFADTGFEPAAVYRHVKWSKKQAEDAGLPFHIVQPVMNMRQEFSAFCRDKKHWDSRPPLWIGASDSKFNRQCTKNGKITPINKKILALMGHKTARTAQDAEADVWVGISTDEARRATPGRIRWVDLQYPLIDPKRMSRSDCQGWWDGYYPDVPLPSSSCTICPYHSDRWWRDMPAEDFAEACDYDDKIRAAYKRKTSQVVYLHRSGKPLRSIDFDHGQPDMFSDDDMICSGGCGL